MALCIEMLVAAGVENDRDAARLKVDAAVTSGNAADRFERMVAGLGGPTDFVENYSQHLPQAAITQPVFAAESGYIVAEDAFLVGNAIIRLGGGRAELDDVLDLSVGLTNKAPIGTWVDKERPLALIHASSTESAEAAATMIRQACQIADTQPSARPVIGRIFTAE